MSDPFRPAPAGGSRWSRRSVLALGLAAGALAETGCTVSDPAIRPAGGRTQASRPGPGASSGPTAQPPGSTTAADAAAELLLAGAAGSLAAGSAGLSARQRSLLELVWATHLERAAALSSRDPAGRPTSPGSTPFTVPSRRTSRRALVAAERRRARRCRSVALTSAGLPALLWGSMAVASARFADALGADDAPAAAAPRQHRPMPVLGDSEAIAALVTSLHAAVYGYQLAVGRLAVGGRAHARATTGLADRRALLDGLSDRLVDAGVEVPPAAPAYDPSPEVRDAGTAARLIRRIESALLPFCGLWLAAAARPADRRLAFDALSDTAVRAGTWGAPLQAWPGWQD